MAVSQVRKILLDIKTFDRTKKGMVEEDYARADSLLKIFNEERANQINTLTPKDIKPLLSTLNERWDDMLAKGKTDYLVDPSGHNQFWIDLAKVLAENKVVKRHTTASDAEAQDKDYKNVWELLMPTLTEQHEEPVSQAPFSEIDPSELILNTDRTELLSLKAAFENAQHNNAIYCFPYDGKPRRFTQDERERIELYRKKALILYKPTHVSLDHHRHILEQPRITKETVLALKALAEGSASQQGIGWEVNDPKMEEYTLAAKAYEEFREYLKKLTPEEKDALRKQLIESSLAGERTFGEEYDDTIEVRESEPQLCTTHVAFAWAKLVMQYMPDVVFNNPILEKQKISDGWMLELPLDENSQIIPLGMADRVPFTGFDRDLEDKNYYKHACLNLLVFLMSNQFTVAPIVGGESVSFKSQTNSAISTSAAKMLEMLKKVYEQASQNQEVELKLYKHAYFKILHYIVRPALKDPSPTRYADTQSWLDSLNDESFWTKQDKEDSLDFHQTDLGAKLLFFITEHNNKHIMKYRDRIMQLATQEAPYNDASIELMIVAKKIKAKCGDDETKRLQSYLSGENTPFTAEPSRLYLKEMIIRRYLYYYSYKEVSRLNPGNLFKTNSESNELLFAKLISLLSNVQANTPPTVSIMSIIDKVAKEADKMKLDISKVGKLKASQFLKQFESGYLNAEDDTLSVETELDDEWSNSIGLFG